MMTIEIVTESGSAPSPEELREAELLSLQHELKQMGEDGLRDVINSCDESVLLALAMRQIATDQMGREKALSGKNVYQHSVETAKLKWVEDMSVKYDLDPKMTVAFWVGIMGRSKDRQNAIKYRAGNSAVANMFGVNDRV